MTIAKKTKRGRPPVMHVVSGARWRGLLFPEEALFVLLGKRLGQAPIEELGKIAGQFRFAVKAGSEVSVAGVRKHVRKVSGHLTKLRWSIEREPEAKALLLEMHHARNLLEGNPVEAQPGIMIPARPRADPEAFIKALADIDEFVKLLEQLHKFPLMMEDSFGVGPKTAWDTMVRELHVWFETHVGPVTYRSIRKDGSQGRFLQLIRQIEEAAEWDWGSEYRDEDNQPRAVSRALRRRPKRRFIDQLPQQIF